MSAQFFWEVGQLVIDPDGRFGMVWKVDDDGYCLLVTIWPNVSRVYESEVEYDQFGGWYHPKYLRLPDEEKRPEWVQSIRRAFHHSYPLLKSAANGS